MIRNPSKETFYRILLFLSLNFNGRGAKCLLAFGNLPLLLTIAWISPFLFFLLDPSGPHYQLCLRPNNSTGRAKDGRNVVQKKKCKARDYTQITKITYLQSGSRTEKAGF